MGPCVGDKHDQLSLSGSSYFPGEAEDLDVGCILSQFLKAGSFRPLSPEWSKQNTLQARPPKVDGGTDGGRGATPYAFSHCPEAGGSVPGSTQRGNVTAGKPGDTCCPRGVPSLALGLETDRLQKPFWFSSRCLLPALAAFGHAGHAPHWFSTHHANLSCHEVTQSVEPFYVSLQVLGLVTETGLGKMQGPHSVFLSIIL